MNEKLIWAGLLLAVGLAAPARADWQYTHWGMSPEAVVAASKGTATRNLTTNDASGGFIGATNLLVAPYNSGDYQFRAVFAFSPQQKLIGVRLDLVNASAGTSLERELV
jgi:hypothetical protein